MDAPIDTGYCIWTNMGEEWSSDPTHCAPNCKCTDLLETLNQAGSTKDEIIQALSNIPGVEVTDSPQQGVEFKVPCEEIPPLSGGVGGN